MINTAKCNGDSVAVFGRGVGEHNSGRRRESGSTIVINEDKFELAERSLARPTV
jgi:hypothetical protein